MRGSPGHTQLQNKSALLVALLLVILFSLFDL